MFDECNRLKTLLVVGLSLIGLTTVCDIAFNGPRAMGFLAAVLILRSVFGSSNFFLGPLNAGVNIFPYSEAPK